VAAPLERCREHHLALHSGQRRQARQSRAGFDALLHLAVHSAAAFNQVELDCRGPYTSAELADRDVVDDPVEPRSDVADLLTAPQRDPGLEQRLLQHVLRTDLGFHQPSAVRQ
jgi:hypothetical protein